MASRRERLSAQRIRRASKQRDKGMVPSLGLQSSGPDLTFTETRPRGIEKEEPRRVRISAHLEGISQLQKGSEDRKPEQRNTSLSMEEACTHSLWYTAGTRLTGGATGLSASSAIEGPKATSRSRTPSESYTDRAASKTSSTFTRRPFSRADVGSGGSW